ncbi:amidase [Amphritea sp.]|uniref:amidase n=1 Tax=Amphritea sp. TaxID=1872502 RepID=UPI003A95A8CA
MTIHKAKLDDIQNASSSLGFTLSPTEAKAHLAILDAVHAEYCIVDALRPKQPAVSFPRTPGYFPTDEENPYNAWYVKSEIRGNTNGQLAGISFAIKDNFCVAGLPMMNGSSTLQGYVPDIDATAVTRLLEEGAVIKGKAQCEYFCVSGSSHTSAQGPVINPRKAGHSAGGSSSGCSALVASGEVDVALGTDQGGSVRIPAAYAGFYGMKPTHGLIPYTGVMPVEMTLDHVGIMSADVTLNAKTLNVLQGHDGLDPRQHTLSSQSDVLATLHHGCQGLKIAVVEEGFAWPNSQPVVDDAVRQAAEYFQSLGAQVTTISIPLHRHGHAIWTPIATEGTLQQLKGYNYGSNWKGLYITSLMRAQQDWQQHSQQFPHDVKSCLLAGEYFHREYNGQFYAKAQNLVRRLKEAYQSTLEQYDLLLMPTVPLQAPMLDAEQDDVVLYVQRALEMNANTAPFNATGLPAMSLPCAMKNDLPVGMMLIANDGHEGTIYQAAYAFEQAYDWTSL